MPKEIKLTRNMVAIVDDENFEWLNQWKWYAQKSGNTYYAKRRETQGEKKFIYMHRLIMRAKPGQEIDHANGNGWDNRIENMRFCTDSQNFQNSRKRKNCSSKYKGVHYANHAKKWRAMICAPGVGKSSHIGCYSSEREAAKSYNEKAKVLFGEFANLNKM